MPIYGGCASLILLRDTQFAIACGDEGFSVGAETAAPARNCHRTAAQHALRDTTLAQYRTDLDRRLDRMLALPRCGGATERLRRHIARDRGQRFVIITT